MSWSSDYTTRRLVYLHSRVHRGAFASCRLARPIAFASPKSSALTWPT